MYHRHKLLELIQVLEVLLVTGNEKDSTLKPIEMQHPYRRTLCHQSQVAQPGVQNTELIKFYKALLPVI
jgi:hypothetical protein